MVFQQHVFLLFVDFIKFADDILIVFSQVIGFNMKIDGVKLAVRLLGRRFVSQQNFVAGLFAGLTPVVIPGIKGDSVDFYNVFAFKRHNQVSLYSLSQH